MTAVEDARVREFLRRAMIMRVATSSARGTPHLTPLRFVSDGRRLYTIIRAGSPTARHLEGGSQAVLLLDAERISAGDPVLRVRTGAARRRDLDLLRWFERRAAAKYFLRPGGVGDVLRHWRRLPTWIRNRRRWTAEDNALIEFLPEQAEFLPRPPTGPV